MIRGNIAHLREVCVWQQICEGPLESHATAPDEEAFLRTALSCLPPLPWTKHTWTQWTEDIKQRTGYKGKALYHPLRVALTGRDDGPQMKAFFPFLKPDLVKQRLGGCSKPIIV
jgi:glutamyl-tRNA synthetase